MSETLAVVEVGGFERADNRGDSVLFQAHRRFGDVTLLEWVVRRISDAQHIDRIIVLAPDWDAEAARRRLPADAMVVSACERDSLARLAGVARRFHAHGTIRVALTSPLVDPSLIDRLTATSLQHKGLDYVGYCSRTGIPAMQSHLGLFAEWVRTDALIRADQKATKAADRDEPTHFILSHPEMFQLRLIPVPDSLDRQDVRLTADMEEDWDHLQTIVEALGHDGLEWQRIAGLLDQQPALRKRMADLNSNKRPSQPA